jgi:hypothetical protein
VAGAWLITCGVAIYITERWRDPEGRGSVFNGALDGPQVAAIVFVLAAAMVLMERKRSSASPAVPPGLEDQDAAREHLPEPRGTDEASHG